MVVCLLSRPPLPCMPPYRRYSICFPKRSNPLSSQPVSQSVIQSPQSPSAVLESDSLSLSLSLSPPLSLLVHLPNSRTDRWTHKRRKGLLPTDEAGSPPPLLLFVSPCEKCKSSEVVERGWFCGRGQAGGSRSLMPLIQLSGLALRTHPSFSPK